MAKELKDIVKSFRPAGFKAALCKEQLEGFSVPLGLYVSTNNEMKGGFEKTQSKTIYGGTIEDERFEKLYGGVVQRITKRPSKTQKKR